MKKADEVRSKQKEKQKLLSKSNKELILISLTNDCMFNYTEGHRPLNKKRTAKVHVS